MLLSSFEEEEAAEGQEAQQKPAVSAVCSVG